MVTTAWEATESDAGDQEAQQLTRDLDASLSSSDLGIHRAGQFVAARRAELGISQRQVGEVKVLSPAALVAFEKGRSWPRDDTLDKLEDLLELGRGTLAQIRYSTALSPHSAGPSAPVSGLPPDPATALPLRTMQSCVRLITALSAALPAPTAPRFTDQVTGVLAELRELRAVATELARLSRQPAAITTLGHLHRLYTDTMERAAASPHATPGQQLCTARRVLDLSVDDVAAITDVPVAAIAAAENDEHVGAAHDAALTQFLSTTVRG